VTQHYKYRFSWKIIFLLSFHVQLLLGSSSSQLTQYQLARCFRLSQKRTLLFEKATISVGSVLKWRARSQYTLSIELNWQPEQARYFKTEPTDIVAFSNAIDSVSFGRCTGYKKHCQMSLKRCRWTCHIKV
jgi:hypothetical protein